MIVTAVILLAISVISGIYFFYTLNNKVDRLFAQLAVKNDNSEVIKAIESIDVKVDNSEIIRAIGGIKLDNSDVIKTIEGGVNEILIKVDNSTKTVTDILENLTIVIQE